jgi:hypothetical protein
MAPLPRGSAREEKVMTCASKLICSVATLLVAFTLTAAPAKAQFGGFGGEATAGGQDMMTQMAPMLEMMKAKMGKKRFAMLMQTMGPMMSQMMQGGGGFGGSGGGFGGALPGGFGGGGFSPDGFGMNSGAGFDVGSIMSMVGPMMQMANLGGGHHRRHRHK